MPLSRLLTPGRILILLCNLAYSLGAFVADYNETHIYNPGWPPHAKFHNGQTMTLGVLLALASLAFLHKSTLPGRSRDVVGQDLWWAAMIGSFYCVAGLSAIWYPDTAWTDPEFWVEGQMTQAPIFGAVVAGVWVGYWVEMGRMGRWSGLGEGKGLA